MTEVLAAGLLELSIVCDRSMTVVTCLQESWDRLEARGLAPMRQRFAEPTLLQGMNERAAASALIAGRLAPAYAEAGFRPPSQTWPFGEKAIADAAALGMMPRTLLMRCDAFRRHCLASETVELCTNLLGATVPLVSPPRASDFDLPAACREADISGIDSDEDAWLGQLLRDAFDIYALEDDPDDTLDVVSKGEPDQRMPPLHGRLTFIHRDENDRERHVCYRALPHPNANAFQARLRAALTASGISARIPDRALLLVRRGPIPSGAKTKQLFEAFMAAGGRLVDPSDDDLRIFVALRDLRAQAQAEGASDRFERWLRAEQPLLTSTLFREAGLAHAARMIEATPAVGTAPVAPEREPVPEVKTQGDTAAPPPTSPMTSAIPEPDAALITPEAIPVGHRLTPEATPVVLPTRLLPRHTAIIAGSGSGKTVLLRRLVEEAALTGIPAIVIDPNNDLSRLGQAWPERPEGFGPEDAAKATLYRARVEVVVWTPGLHAGNPLFLSVLPDFAGVGTDRDEREQAIEMAAETLGPLAGAKTALQRGVLADALRRFAETGAATSRPSWICWRTCRTGSAGSAARRGTPRPWPTSSTRPSRRTRSCGSRARCSIRATCSTGGTRRAHASR